MITLLYLTFGGDIKMDTFEIQEDCSGWFHHNVKVLENKKRTLMSIMFIMSTKVKKKVIGYICGDEPPQ